MKRQAFGGSFDVVEARCPMAHRRGERDFCGAFLCELRVWPGSVTGIRCKQCNAKIYVGFTDDGRLTYDVVDKATTRR